MSSDSHTPIEQTPVFITFERIAETVWNLVASWPSFAKWTLGKQLTEAADSVGFNLVEGDGRYSDAEAIHFFHISRGSARETKLGIERSRARGLMPDETALEMIREIDEASKQLNGLISYRKRTKAARVVREVVAAYDSDSSGLNA